MIVLPGGLPVSVQIVSVTHQIVKVGIEAARDISIWREEVWRKIQREKQPYV